MGNFIYIYTRVHKRTSLYGQFEYYLMMIEVIMLMGVYTDRPKADGSREIGGLQFAWTLFLFSYYGLENSELD